MSGHSRLGRWFSFIVVAGMSGQALLFGPPPAARAASLSHAQPAPAAVSGQRPAFQQELANLPLAFEPNRGQTDGRVRYLAHAGGSTIFLTDQGIVIASLRPTAVAAPRLPSAVSPAHPVLPQTGTPAVLQLIPQGAAPHPRLVASSRLPGIVNYLIGHTAHTDIPTYAAVTYQNIYPGIDLAVHGGKQGLEYDWILAAGADASRIALQVRGTNGLRLPASGNLVMRTPVGTVVEGQPRLYQLVRGRKQQIAGGFRLTGSTVRLWVGQYDPHRPLIVDPTQTLLYSTYLGGSYSDVGTGIAVDSSGDAYITGYTYSSNFPICPDNGGTAAYCASHTGSPAQLASGGNGDAFVAELNPTGTKLLYSTYLGGTGFDEGTGVAVDSSGDAFVTGYTLSTDFPICPDNGGTAAYCASHTGSPVQPTFGGEDGDAFITELDPTGTKLLYSTYLGGSSYDWGTGIAVDGSGDAYITGYTYSSDFPICPDNGGTAAYCASHTGSPVQSTYGGSEDAFVAELNPTGTKLLYSTYLGGSYSDVGNGIAVDSSGDAYITGYTYSSNFPICPDNGGTAAYCASHTGSPAQPTLGGVQDAFVSKLSVVVGIITVTGQPLTCTTGVACSGTVAIITDTDGNPCSNYTAMISWGDGSASTAGTVSGTNATSGCAVSGMHTYLFPGRYTVSISVTDADGTTGSGQTIATVGSFPTSSALTTIDAGSSPGACGSELTLSIGIHVGSTGGITGVLSFQDPVAGVVYRTAAGFVIQSVQRLGNGRFNGSGNRAVIYGTQGTGAGTVTVRIDLADLGIGACTDSIRVRTSSGYDSGTRPVSQVSIISP